jgi:hypothetical protein
MIQVMNRISQNVEVTLACGYQPEMKIYASVTNVAGREITFKNADMLIYNCGSTLTLTFEDVARIYIVLPKDFYGTAAVLAQRKGDNGGNLGLIIGIAVGAVGLIAAIFVGVYCSKKRQNDLN